MSGETETGQEKSHEATPGKLDRARKKGDMPRSPDAQTAMAYLGLSLFLLVFGGASAVSLGETLMIFLGRPTEMAELLLGGASQASGTLIATRLTSSISGLFLMPAIAVIGLLIAQRSIVIAPEKLKPKISRISPVANAKQKYGLSGLVEFAKAAVKLTAIGAILGYALWSESDELARFSRIEVRQLPAILERQFWNLMQGVLILTVAVGAIDILWQRHSHRRKMRMTHQELRDETKQAEGDPHFRSTRRERAREIANNRMLHDVAKSDVVVVNPTHFAVALKWSRKERAVPMCLAKGTDELAHRIRRKAEMSGVPVHEDAPTARSIHALVEIGQPIKEEHYRAVAAAIVFADKMRAKERERIGNAGHGNSAP